MRASAAAARSCSSLSSGICEHEEPLRPGGRRQRLGHRERPQEAQLWPENRCQSAVADVVIFPRGPMPSILSTGPTAPHSRDLQAQA